MLGLEVQSLQYTRERSLPCPGDWDMRAAAAAQDLYRSVLWRAQAGRWWSLLAHQPHTLLRLSQPSPARFSPCNHAGGVRTVPLRQIRGSECRAEEFDRCFRPLQKRTQARWLGIATARKIGVAMPPVELIQIGSIYFVRDGHHRISVARALGQQYIEAQVTVCERKGETVWEQSAAAHLRAVEDSGVGVSR